MRRTVRIVGLAGVVAVLGIAVLAAPVGDLASPRLQVGAGSVPPEVVHRALSTPWLVEGLATVGRPYLEACANLAYLDGVEPYSAANLRADLGASASDAGSVCALFFKGSFVYGGLNVIRGDRVRILIGPPGTSPSVTMWDSASEPHLDDAPFSRSLDD